MQLTTNNKRILMHDVDTENVKLKCVCPRCKAQTVVSLIDYGSYGGLIECGFCMDDGWDDCKMPMTSIEVTYI